MTDRSNRPLVSLRVVVAGVLAASCSSSGNAAPGSAARFAPVPPPAPVVEVAMGEYRFDYDAAAIPAGRVVFRARNVGGEPHNLVMIPLAEDLPPIEVQLRGSERRLVEPFAGFYDRPPGDTGSFAVDLVPGRRYAMICTLPAPDNEPHWRKGMVTEFRTHAGGG